MPTTPPLPPFPVPDDVVGPGALASVIVTNHNYARFLGAALDSALHQAAGPVEVIVVDDGSTDDSGRVLDAYADRVKVLRRTNQGQKAAFNAGFEHARGGFVLFLDADDTLDSDVVGRVRTAFADRPGAARVVFRLMEIDEDGHPTGRLVPSAALPLAAGDMRADVLRHADDVTWPPTSGNAFATSALRRIMPLPVDADPTGGDLYLHPLTPLLGEVVALDGLGGAYRAHGANTHHRSDYDPARSRVILRRAAGAHAALRRMAAELGHGPVRPRSVTLAAHRLLSLRMGGPGHPVLGDSRRRALGAGVRAAAARTDLPPARRAVYAAWFVSAAVAPRAALPTLSALVFMPERRPPVLGRLVRR